MSSIVIRRAVAAACGAYACFFLVAILHAPAPREPRGADLAWAIPVALLIAGGGTAMTKLAIADPDGRLMRAASWFGAILGLMWLLEICVTAALPVPVSEVHWRDLLQDSIWALIAVGMASAAALTANRTTNFSAGVWVGTWAGLLCGLFAAFASLVLDTVLIGLVVRDPSEKAEFAVRGPAQGYHDVAAYAARQTLFGSLFHLLFLGVAMGVVLGLAGAWLGTHTPGGGTSNLRGRGNGSAYRNQDPSIEACVSAVHLPVCSSGIDWTTGSATKSTSSLRQRRAIAPRLPLLLTEQRQRLPPRFGFQ